MGSGSLVIANDNRKRNLNTNNTYMSLNWNVSKIKDQDTLCWKADETMNPITESLIWKCMAIDMGEITEKNWKEFLFRCRFMSEVFGKPLRRIVDDKLESFDYTVQDIMSHIGLSTNVSTKSRKYFLKRTMNNIERSVEYNVRNETTVPNDKE